MANLRNVDEYVKTIVIAYIAGELVKLLPDCEGRKYCEEKILLCWKWIERNEFDMEAFENCLDSMDDKDLVYYVSNETIQEYQEIYNVILQCVSFTAMQALSELGECFPEYLDGVEDDEYYELTISLAIKKCSFLKEKIKEISNYCTKKIQDDTNEIIKRSELLY